MLAGENIGKFGDCPLIHQVFPSNQYIKYMQSIRTLTQFVKFLHVWIDFSKVSPRQCFALYGKQMQLQIF